MKQSLLICAAAALLAGSSCSEQEPFDAAMPVRLSVAGISPGSRAAANYAADDYFGLRGMAGASVSVKARTTTYIYADGTLAGATPDDVLYFPVDGSALASVKVYWPEEAVRQAQGGAIAKDQREKEAFLAADWLSAELKEVAPAQAVALTLGHERPKLTFTLAGTMSGSRITALSVAGYDAYCDPQTGDAQLIMLPGNTEIALEAIGTVTKDSYDAIKRATDAYNALTPVQKALVPQWAIDLLEEATAKYKELTAADDTASAEQPAELPLDDLRTEEAAKPDRPFDWTIVWMGAGILAALGIIVLLWKWFSATKQTRRRNDE